MSAFYKEELDLQTEYLYEQMAFLEKEISDAQDHAKNTGDYKTYGKLVRLYIPIEKEYMRLCAEQDRFLEAEESKTDALTAFAAAV